MSERVLIVIPCLNEEAYLEKLVNQLAAVGRTLPMRIIIADGGSKDRTAQISQDLVERHPNVLFFYNPGQRQAAAVNMVIAEQAGEAKFLIRIDAHADYPDDYCQTLVEEAINTGADSVVVAMNTGGKTLFQNVAAAAQNSLLGNGGATHRIIGKPGMWIDHGHHALMRIAAFRAVGGYDESFPYNEDAELDTRLRQAGYKIWLTGKTSLVYYPRSSPRALFRQYMHHGYGRACNILKHRTLPKLRQLAPAAVLPAVLLALLTPVWPVFGLPLAIWAIFCLGYGALLGWRAKDPLFALSGPTAMIMHCGWSVGFWLAIISSSPPIGGRG